MDGNLIEGASDVTLAVSETAFYSANIVINDTDCTFTDEILVEFFSVPNVIAVDENVIKCANEDYILEVEVTNANELNSKVKTASLSHFKDIIEYNTLPLVSIDFNHNSASSIFDSTQTQVTGENFGRILSWYDNEWGFSNRMIDVCKDLGKFL